MLNTILATKEKMSQTFADGKRVGGTVVKAGPCTVTQIRTEKKDGYESLQISLKNGKKYFTREIEKSQEKEYKVGDKIKLTDIFSVGDTVQVTGTSKGKGFVGVVKRWGFHGGPKTHGQSDRHRAPGSIGQGTTPGRVFKGKKMAGRMGSDTVTVKNLKVVEIYADKNSLLVSGPIPGRPGTLLKIKRTSKSQVGKTEEGDKLS